MGPVPTQAILQVFNSETGDGIVNLEFDSPTTLNGTEWNIGDRSPGAYFDQFPSSYYDSQGRTLNAVAMPWLTDYRNFGGLVMLDRYGLYPAFIEANQKMLDNVDRHLYPAIAENNAGKIIMLEEYEHLDDIMVYIGDSDLSKFTYVDRIDELSARYNIFKLATGFALIYQYNDNDIAVRTFDENGANWSARSIVVNSVIANVRVYPAPILGTNKPINGWFYFLAVPIYNTGALTRVEFLLKTQDFVTYYNDAETHSFVAGAGLTEQQLSDNGYVVFGSLSNVIDINVNPWAIDSSGNIIRVGWTTGTKLNIARKIEGVWTYYDSESDFNFSTSHFGEFCLKWSCIRGSNIFLLATISNGVVGKPHLLRSNDAGLTWTDLGDIIPDLNNTTGYYRALGPMNANHIPDSTNFAFFVDEPTFNNVTGQYSSLYCVKSAFGTLQADQAKPTPTIITNINDVSGARYIYETDNISGGLFIDKSSNARTVTATGAPTLVGDAMVYDGVDDSFQLSNFANFLSDTEFTIFIIAGVGFAWSACNVPNADLTQ